MQVEFSKIAEQTLTENVEFLKKVWTNREVVIFLEDVKKIANDLEDGEISAVSKINKKYKKCLNRQKARKNVFQKRK
ncbi:hypothetical protein [Chryseobacterium sp.]|uniref:hypothetical protein n=1 Tax=Chryseobacterium sp. TaxID=1871047 RepID=UPI002FC7BE05